MKRTVMTVALTLAALVCASALPATAEDQLCSKESLVGSYWFVTNGTVPGVLVTAGLARVVFDGHGNFAEVDNGQLILSGQPPIPIINRPGTGTYTIMPDCTGTETLTTGGQMHHSSFILLNHGKEILDFVTDRGVAFSGIGIKEGGESD